MKIFKDISISLCLTYRQIKRDIKKSIKIYKEDIKLLKL